MTDMLHDQIEAYVAGVMAGKEKEEFEEQIAKDVNLHQQIIEIGRVREALLRYKSRTNVTNARAYINRPKKGLNYVIGTFAAAASVILFLLSTAVTLSPTKFNYRGDAFSTNIETQSRANDFQKATQLIEEGENPNEAIKILEKLKDNESVSKNYQNESKWMLVAAYLQAGKPEKAEEVFNKVKWEDTGRPFSTWEITKIHWQIFWGKLF